MSFREATLEALEYGDPVAQATEFHEERVECIASGDHGLDVDPLAVLHIIPDGAVALAEDDVDLPTGSLPRLIRDPRGSKPHKEGRVSATYEEPKTAYTIQSPTGALELASGGNVRETEKSSKFSPASIETAVTGCVNWAQENLTESEEEGMTVVMTLLNLKGMDIRIPDRVRPRSHGGTVPFQSDEIDILPERVSGGDWLGSETYEALMPLFSRAWASTGVEGAIYDRDKQRVGRNISEYTP